MGTSIKDYYIRVSCQRFAKTMKFKPQFEYPLNIKGTVITTIGKTAPDMFLILFE